MMWKLLLCLMGLGVLLPSFIHSSPTVTEQIIAALDAADNLTQALRNDSFEAVLTTFDATIDKWTVGIDKLFYMLRHVEAIDPKLKQRYVTVSEELGSVLENLVEMRDKINWKGTSFEYPKIEDKIYELDQKLSQVFEVRSRGSSIIRDFVRHYDKGYSLEAIELFRATVDGRLLEPVLEYTQSIRQPTVTMMRGLIALTLKGATLEIADQNFKSIDRNEVAIWRKRLEKFLLKMKSTEEILLAWQKDFRQEVDAIVEAHRNASKENLCDTMYEFMTTKYHWRRWGVVVHNFGYTTYNKTFVYRVLVRVLNNMPTYIIVATTDADSDFDVEQAKKVIATPVDSTGCPPGGNSLWCYFGHMPKLGLMSLVGSDTFNGHPKAIAHGRGSIRKNGVVSQGPAIIYFG